MKTGVLVFNLGGPEKLADVKPFLYKLFSDPQIIQVKTNWLRKLIAYSIATLRHKKSEGYYAQIGGGSPLRRLTEEQARALQDELKRRGKDVQTYVGMCAWHPFFRDTLERIEKERIEKLIILPLFPQYSKSTTGAGYRALVKLLKRRYMPPRTTAMSVRRIQSWPDQPTYIEAFAQAIERELAKFSPPSKAHLLFSAHSVPESYIKHGDPYLDQTKVSVECIMDRLGRKNTYQLSFQSKIGPVKWLEPSTNSVIIELGRKGIGDVLVVPISFVSEHIETLYELDILYKHVAEQAGIPNFRRVPALNCDPIFIRALAEIVEREL